MTFDSLSAWADTETELPAIAPAPVAPPAPAKPAAPKRATGKRVASVLAANLAQWSSDNAATPKGPVLVTSLIPAKAPKAAPVAPVAPVAPAPQDNTPATPEGASAAPAPIQGPNGATAHFMGEGVYLICQDYLPVKISYRVNRLIDWQSLELNEAVWADYRDLSRAAFVAKYFKA